MFLLPSFPKPMLLVLISVGMSMKRSEAIMRLAIVALASVEIILVSTALLGMNLLGYSRPIEALLATMLLTFLLRRRGGAAPFGRELSVAVMTALSLWYSLLVVFALINGFAINSYAPGIVTGLLNLVMDAPLIAVAVMGLGELLKPGSRVARRLLLGVLGFLVFLGMFVNISEIGFGANRQVLMNTGLGLIALFSLLASTITLLRYGSRSLAIGYVLGIRLPIMVSPLLPYLPLALSSFLVMLPSMLIVLYMSSRVALIRGNTRERSAEPGTVIATALAVFLFLLVLWKGYWPMIVLSGSMEPSIRIGDIVVVEKSQQEPHIGDVVAYKYSGMIILHRVINVTGNRLVTKGDANDAPDNPITTRQVLGKLYLRIPYAGLPLIIVARVLGGDVFAAQMLLLATIIALIMLPALARSLRERRAT